MKRRPSSLDLKIVVLGSVSVGKTSIINRYCNKTFIEDTLSTIGAGFFNRNENFDGMDVSIMVWDTAGEERFRSVAPSLLRGANGLVLVYDVTSTKSFKDIDAFMDLYLDTCQVDSSMQLPVLLLGNKADLQVAVSEDTVEEWKRKNKVVYSYNVSAKSGQNVDIAFETLVKSLTSPNPDSENAPIQIVINPQTPKQNKNCC